MYDSNLSGNNLITQTDYDNSAFNRKVKSTVVTNSDNTQVKSSYLYAGDFNTFHLTDQYNSHLRGIIDLVYSNYSRDEVLEQVTELKPNGDAFKVIAAEARLYDRITIGGRNLPALKEIKTIKNLAGLTDFVPMQRTGSIPSRVLTIDGRYQTEKSFADFGRIALPGTVNEKRKLVTIIRDSLLRLPVLQLAGAELSDIGFYNTDRIDNFTLGFSAELWSDNSQYTHVPYFGRAMKFIPTYHEMRKVFTRKTEHKIYKLVFLAKTDTATQVNILINDVVVATVPIVVSANMKFYEKTIDLSSSTSVDLKMTSDGNMVLDNVVFYPADASFVATNYDPVHGKTTEMNSSGMIRLYEYVNGRLASERDGEGNIIKAHFYNNYQETSGLPYYADFTVLNPTKNYAGRTMQFKGTGSCLPGIKYTWNFGDGTTLETYDQNVSHVYASAATYTVSLTLSHPEYSPNHTGTQSLQIKPEVVLTTLLWVSGIGRMNPCTSYKEYVDAPTKPPGYIDCPDGTKFYALVGGCSAGGYQFKWEISYDNSYWEEYDTTSGSTLEIPEWIIWGDYWIRCRIYTPNCDKEIVTPATLIEYNCDVY